MKLCAATRHPTLHQCKSYAVPGCTLCLGHIRRKNVVMWADVNQVKALAAIRCQAAIRGWLLRRRVMLGGPGVLRRRALANDEDLETCNAGTRVHPFAYVAFEEAGKTWWFEFPTLWRWMSRNERPVNPYTKVPLSAETRIRMRALWRYKRMYENEIPAEVGTVPIVDRIRFRLNIVSQMFEDHGFGWISPNQFLDLTRNQWIALFHFVNDELDVTMPKSMARTRSMIRLYIRYLFDSASDMDAESFRSEASRMLFLMLMFPKDPYILAFTTLSALYRV